MSTCTCRVTSLTRQKESTRQTTSLPSTQSAVWSGWWMTSKQMNCHGHRMRCAFFPSFSVCPDFRHFYSSFCCSFLLLFNLLFNFKNGFSNRRRLVSCLFHKKPNFSLTKKEKKRKGMKQSPNKKMQINQVHGWHEISPVLHLGWSQPQNLHLCVYFIFGFLFHFNDIAQNNLIYMTQHLCSNGGKVRNASVEYVK